MSFPKIPLAYQILLYRRKMGISYQEALTTPAQAFYNDWEMLDLENGGSIKTA